MPESRFLIRLEAEACNLTKKETLAQVFFCEFCEIFKNTFYECFWTLQVSNRTSSELQSLTFMVKKSYTKNIWNTVDMSLFVHLLSKCHTL